MLAVKYSGDIPRNQFFLQLLRLDRVSHQVFSPLQTDTLLAHHLLQRRLTQTDLAAFGLSVGVLDTPQEILIHLLLDLFAELLIELWIVAEFLLFLIGIYRELALSMFNERGLSHRAH